MATPIDQDGKELFQIQLTAMEKVFEERITSLSTVHKTQAHALEMALELQAREYERRLGELNGAHARVITDRLEFARARDLQDVKEQIAAMNNRLGEFMLKETHVLYMETINARFAPILKWMNTQDGKLIGAGGIVVFISALIAIVSHFLP